MVGVLKAAEDFAVQNYPRKLDKIIQYGTAGFRTKYVYTACKIWLLSDSNELVSFRAVERKSWLTLCTEWVS